jgi:hypothetical protein
MPTPVLLDNARRVAELLGNFWSRDYAGYQQVVDTIDGTLEIYRQVYQEIQECAAVMSRHTLPIFKLRRWLPIRIQESALVRPPRFYGDGYLYGAGLLYGETDPSGAWRTGLDGVDRIPAMTNRISSASIHLFDGLDFTITDGYLRFRDNPFDNELWAPQTLFDDGEPVDREIILWAHQVEMTATYIYDHLGSVLGVNNTSSSLALRDGLNAIMDAIVNGCSAQNPIQFLSAITGIPFAKADGEVVEVVMPFDDDLYIITDQQVYTFPVETTALVAVGDSLRKYQALTTAAQIHTLNRGVVPDIRALAIGKNLTTYAENADLVFINEAVPIETTTDDDDRLKVTFELGGDTEDVEAFWAAVHAYGLADGRTFAQYLDQRSVQDDEPLPEHLPSTINPLEFLIANILRYNAIVIEIRVGETPSSPIGLHWLLLLRRILPPHVGPLFVFILPAIRDIGEMDDEGNTLEAGYDEEILAGYTAAPVEEEGNEEGGDPGEVIEEPVLAICENPSQVSLLTDLKAWWELDELSGDAIDSTGNHTLTETGTCPPELGPCGSVVSRGYSDSLANFFSAPDDDDFSMMNTLAVSNSFTVAGWFLLNDADVQSMLISKNDGFYQEWQIYTSPWAPGWSHLTFEVNRARFTYNYLPQDPPSCCPQYNGELLVDAADTWYHVTCWWDADLRQIGMSINNGTPQIYQYEVWEADPYRDEEPLSLFLGSNADFATPMYGRMSKWGIWHKVLSNAERTALYAGAKYPFNGT